MIDWEKVPWTLWSYVLATIMGVVLIVARARTPVALTILFVVLSFVWDFALLKGIRWVWLATVILGMVGTLIDLIAGTGTWHGYLLGMVGLGLLLLAPTRRFVAKREETAAA